ncbi:MAG: cupin domain-containing protein [Novosphingobium sp.]|nr:cupin domain-containing protein [Novosphingobium sp.]
MSGVESYRRVVTGLDEDGKSCVLFDGPIPSTGTATGLAWFTPTVPADNSGTDDAGALPFSFDMLHSGGSTFMIAEYPPHSGGDPFWHATDTIDYIVQLSGETKVMMLETGDVILRKGDFVIDRGVIHAWRNDGDEPAVTAIVTIPALPVGKGRNT